MTHEEKQLLIKDICTRLPYGVKVWYKYYPTNVTEKFAISIRLSDNKIALSSKFTKEGAWHPIEEAGEILIKPYLRPMSSMTMEEIKYKLSKFFRIINTNIEGIGYVPTLNSGSAIEYINWLNENHFDYNGLIEKGLAIEALEGMYKI